MLTSACLLLKRQVEKKEDPMPLIDHLTENCQLYKYKLSNFIEYTRAGAGLTRTLREPVNIRELLGNVIGEYRFKAAEKNIPIDLLVADEVPDRIITDEFRIALIAANLLTKLTTYGAVLFMVISISLTILLARTSGDHSVLSGTPTQQTTPKK